MKRYNLITELMLKFERFADAEIEEMRNQALATADPMDLKSPLRQTLRLFATDAGFELEQREHWRSGDVEGDPSAFAINHYQK